MSDILIRPATPDDLDAFRDLRLEALRSHPTAFGADYEENLARPREFWVDRLAPANSGPNTIFVAEAAGELVGMTGVRAEPGRKALHIAWVWGVYVRPAWRGKGIAERLVRACTDWGREHGIRYAKLAVATTNAPALRCYLECGFSVYGVDAEAICWDGTYYDELLMAKNLT